MSSQTYTSKSNAVNGIVSVQINSTHDDHFAKATAADGQHYFTLKANNGLVIGTSEMYTTKEARDNGIESVKENGHTKEIDDKTLMNVS